MSTNNANVGGDASRRFIANTGWLSIGAVVARLAPMVLLYLVLLKTPTSAYGQFAMATAIAAIAILVAEGGVTLTLTSISEISESNERALAHYALVRGTIVYVLTLRLPHAFRFDLTLGAFRYTQLRSAPQYQ